MKRLVAIFVMLVAALSECDKKYSSYETTAVISTANQSDVITMSPISTDRQALTQTAVNEKTTISEKSSDMVELINDYRQSNGLTKLKISAELCDVAMTRALESSELWSHTRPNGEGLDTLLDEKNIRWSLAGENLAKHRRSTDKAVIDAWVASESHRKNLLNPQYRYCGTAEYDSGEIIYVSLILTD